MIRSIHKKSRVWMTTECKHFDCLLRQVLLNIEIKSYSKHGLHDNKQKTFRYFEWIFSQCPISNDDGRIHSQNALFTSVVFTVDSSDQIVKSIFYQLTPFNTRSVLRHRKMFSSHLVKPLAKCQTVSDERPKYSVSHPSNLPMLLYFRQGSEWFKMLVLSS